VANTVLWREVPVRSNLTAVDEDLAKAVMAEWLDGATMRPLTAMNSSAWKIEAGGSRYVLKLSRPSDGPGLSVATLLEDRGIRAGAPVRTTVRDGRLVALLRFAGGRPLSADDWEAVGETLGLAHRLLAGVSAPPEIDRWPWRWLDTAIIDEAALRSSAAAAVERATGLTPGLTQGILHGDPAPEAFVDDGADVGLIDWGAACYGPLLYDVASAWMYTGERVVDAYARAGPLGPDELEHAADFLAFRFALQAWYFSTRLAGNDLTGLESRDDNLKGLADARAGLLG